MHWFSVSCQVRSSLRAPRLWQVEESLLTTRGAHPKLPVPHHHRGDRRHFTNDSTNPSAQSWEALRPHICSSSSERGHHCAFSSSLPPKKLLNLQPPLSLQPVPFSFLDFSVNAQFFSKAKASTGWSMPAEALLSAPEKESVKSQASSIYNPFFPTQHLLFTLPWTHIENNNLL